MSATVECHTLIFGKTGTITVYADGSNTPISAGAFSSTARPGCYTFANTSLTGLYRVDVIATGQTNPFWSGWVVLATSGTCVCEDERNTAQVFAQVLTQQMTESYAADGVNPTLAQAIFLIQQSLHEFSISGAARTVKGLDGVTPVATFTLDSATAPTATSRTA